MEETRAEKLLRACKLVKAQDEKETELMTLVAQSMQTGFELGRMMERETQASAQSA